MGCKICLQPELFFISFFKIINLKFVAFSHLKCRIIEWRGLGQFGVKVEKGKQVKHNVQ